ncbi:unnamed protein product [Closterium sp. NIES-65]|nr:unnamed protein product [Closterium sp. NIES-65]
MLRLFAAHAAQQFQRHAANRAFSALAASAAGGMGGVAARRWGSVWKKCRPDAAAAAPGAATCGAPFDFTQAPYSSTVDLDFSQLTPLAFARRFSAGTAASGGNIPVESANKPSDKAAASSGIGGSDNVYLHHTKYASTTNFTMGEIDWEADAAQSMQPNSPRSPLFPPPPLLIPSPYPSPNCAAKLHHGGDRLGGGRGDSPEHAPRFPRFPEPPLFSPPPPAPPFPPLRSRTSPWRKSTGRRTRRRPNFTMEEIDWEADAAQSMLDHARILRSTHVHVAGSLIYRAPSDSFNTRSSNSGTTTTTRSNAIGERPSSPRGALRSPHSAAMRPRSPSPPRSALRSAHGSAHPLRFPSRPASASRAASRSGPRLRDYIEAHSRSQATYPSWFPPWQSSPSTIPPTPSHPTITLHSLSPLPPSSPNFSPAFNQPVSLAPAPPLPARPTNQLQRNSHLTFSPCVPPFLSPSPPPPSPYPFPSPFPLSPIPQSTNLSASLPVLLSPLDPHSTNLSASLPVLLSPLDPHVICLSIARAHSALHASSPAKIRRARDLFQEHADTPAIHRILFQEASSAHPAHVTPRVFECGIFSKAREAQSHVVLAKGTEPKVVQAAGEVLRRSLCKLTLLGNPEEVLLQAKNQCVDLSGANIVDPGASPDLDRYVELICQAQLERGVTMSVEEARRLLLSDPASFGSAMVAAGEADGMAVGGIRPNGNGRIVRGVIKTRPEMPVVSGVVFMCLPDKVLVYGDSAENTLPLIGSSSTAVAPSLGASAPTNGIATADPTAEELAMIAMSSADTAAAFGVEPRVALLSTQASQQGAARAAQGRLTERIEEAAHIVKEQRPGLAVEGPLPYDTAHRIELLPTAALRANFTAVDVLGKGQYGVVWRLVDRRTAREFACKRVSRAACGENAHAAARREIEIMAKLRGKGSGHIIGLEAVYADRDSLYMLMELGTGGDLLARIQNEGMLSEAESRDIFASVARAVKECHDHSIVHRDIKPENILLCPKKTAPGVAATDSFSHNLSQSSSAAGNPQHVAKLTDFGLSLELPRWQQVVGYAGSYPYEAPEVMALEPYDESADIWSLGVLLYAMLSGTWPLFRNNVRELDDIADWEAPCWSSISDDAKNLIRWMLAVDPLMRPTIDQILADTWLAPPPPPPSRRFTTADDVSAAFPAAISALVAIPDIKFPQPDFPEPNLSKPAPKKLEISLPEAPEHPVSPIKNSPRGNYFSSPKHAAAALKHVVPTCLAFKMRAGRRGSSRVAPTAVCLSQSVDGAAGARQSRPIAA